MLAEFNLKKMTSNDKSMELQLNNCISRLQEILQMVITSNKNPEIYLTNKLFKDESDMFYVLNNLMMNYGEVEFKNFQMDYINKIYTYLNVLLPSDDMKIETLVNEEGIYYLYGSIRYMDIEIPLFHIYPFYKTYEQVEYSDLKELKEKYSHLEAQAKEKYARIDVLKQAYTNPILYTGENVKLYAKLSLNKKKLETLITNEINELLVEIQGLENDMQYIEDDMQMLEDALLSIYVLRDRYLDRLATRYHFQPNPEDYDMEEEINSTIAFTPFNEVSDGYDAPVEDELDEDDERKLFFQSFKDE